MDHGRSGGENVGLGIAESRSIDKRLLMSLVLDDCGGIEAEDLLQSLTRAHDPRGETAYPMEEKDM